MTIYTFPDQEGCYAGEPGSTSRDQPAILGHFHGLKLFLLASRRSLFLHPYHLLVLHPRLRHGTSSPVALGCFRGVGRIGHDP